MSPRRSIFKDEFSVTDNQGLSVHRMQQDKMMLNLDQERINLAILPLCAVNLHTDLLKFLLKRL